MGKKGLSVDEKRTRAQAYFHETKEVYSMKELEKKLKKHKGITSQSVEEIVKGLMYDELVDHDKIGSGNYYWSLPSKGLMVRRNKIKKLEVQVSDVDSQFEKKQSQLQKAEEVRPDTEERRAKLARLAALQKEQSELETKLKKYSACDPDMLKELDGAAIVCRDAANRWTDNIDVMRAFFRRYNAELTDEKFYKHFDLPVDIDSLE